MSNWTISGVKNASKRILTTYYMKCVFASFICGVFLSLVLTYTLDIGNSGPNSVSSDAIIQSIYGDGNPETVNANINQFLITLQTPEYKALVNKILLAELFASLIQLVFAVFVTNPFGIGLIKFYTDAHSIEPQYKTLLLSFKTNYANIVKTLLIKDVKIILYSLLLIIPGVIKSYEYFMVPYLLSENPDMDYKEAMTMSSRMMDGQKMNTFLLNLSFIGWMLASSLSAGILYIMYVGPYIDGARANVALRIKSEYKAKAIII